MADKTITQLPVAAAIGTTDVSVLVSNNVDYQFNFALLLQFISANIAIGAAITFGTVVPQNNTGNNGDVFFKTDTPSFYQKTNGAWIQTYSAAAATITGSALLYGQGVPGSSIGNNDDSYINTVTGIFYLKTAGTWNQVFSMATGPQGPQGTPGVNGTNGTNGNTLISGTTDPANTIGNNGDYYINLSTYGFFGPKASGAWALGVSLIGGAGATGPAGATGVAGAQGIPGVAGTNGAGIIPGGTAGQVLSKIDNTDFNTEWINPPETGTPTGVIPIVTDGTERAVTQKNDGTHIDYEVIDQIVSDSNLSTADFSSGIATVNGLQGQIAYDTNYKYECIGVNQWIRYVIDNNLIDLYLVDVNDTAGDKTSAQLQEIYPGSLIGQQVWGVNNLYIKKTSTGWKKITMGDA
jgi:hypothetical protein